MEGKPNLEHSKREFHLINSISNYVYFHLPNSELSGVTIENILALLKRFLPSDFLFPKTRVIRFNSFCSSHL
jgi:hypothetical protein